MAFTTRDNLLSAVQHGDEIAWAESYRMYKPLILLRGDDLCLNNTEKEELVQLVMFSFFKTSRTFQYGKSRGRFRDYLKRVIQNKACDLIRKRHNEEISTENTRQTVEKLFAERMTAGSWSGGSMSCSSLLKSCATQCPLWFARCSPCFLWRICRERRSQRLWALPPTPFMYIRMKP